MTNHTSEPPTGRPGANTRPRIDETADYVPVRLHPEVDHAIQYLELVVFDSITLTADMVTGVLQRIPPDTWECAVAEDGDLVESWIIPQGSTVAALSALVRSMDHALTRRWKAEERGQLE